MIQNTDASAYLLGIIDSGVHEYKLNISRLKRGLTGGWKQTIGIWKVNENNKPPWSGDFFLKARKGSLGLNNRGRRLVGEKLYPGDDQHDYNNCPGYKSGDTVDMIIDFDKLELRFKINGKDYGKAGDLNPEHKYRVAVSLMIKDDAIQLL